VGWAGPAQLTGPDSTPKGLGRSRPNKSLFLVWARSGPDIRDGPKSVWPTNTSELGQNQLGPAKETQSMLGQHQPGPA